MTYIDAPRCPNFPNSLLSALSAPELEPLTPHLIPCLFHSDQTLYLRGEEVKDVYFPKSGAISLLLSSAAGVDVEVGMIGRKGALGALEALSHNPLSTRAQVQMAGSGWRLSADMLRLECARNEALLQAVLRGAHSLNEQTSQCVLCNRLHSVEQRLTRWLLMCADRMGTPSMELTHEFISNMLGARRVGVTLAAGVLREAGLIEYSRGHIEIIDRLGLEARACECYTMISSGLNPLQPRELRNGLQLNHSPNDSLLNGIFTGETAFARKVRPESRI